MMRYYQFFVDAWRFFKRYYQSAEDKDEWWEEMISSANAITKEYKNRPFAIAVMCAITDELERRVRA